MLEIGVQSLAAAWVSSVIFSVLLFPSDVPHVKDNNASPNYESEEQNVK